MFFLNRKYVFERFIFSILSVPMLILGLVRLKTCLSMLACVVARDRRLMKVSWLVTRPRLHFDSLESIFGVIRQASLK